MGFQIVTRQKAKLRMALTGVSGAGKTLGALYIAYGITGDWGKIALIDTEHERARFYANRSDLNTGEFLYSPLDPPYSPDRYRDLVREGATAVGPEGVVIVDSLSHAWDGEGGVLEIKNQIAEQQGKNSYTAWDEAGHIQKSLINDILSVHCHTIVTMRSKMAYALEMNDKGRQQPVKLGLAPVQRDNTEYEFDVVLDIARNHVATASKDTTILDKYGEVISPALGTRLEAWLSQGVEPELCDACGHTITPTPTKSIAELIEGSQRSTGRKMCANCLKRWAAGHKSRAAIIGQINENMTPEQWQSCISAWARDEREIYLVDDSEYERLLAILRTPQHE